MARTHEEVDRRSLALHAEVAARLRAQPSLLRIARENLERWRRRREDGDPAASAIQEWQEILDTLSLDDLCDLLMEQSERGDRLRQSSPFAGILTPAQVWEIKRSFTGEKTRA